MQYVDAQKGACRTGVYHTRLSSTLHPHILRQASECTARQTDSYLVWHDIGVDSLALLHKFTKGIRNEPGTKKASSGQTQ